MARFYARFDGGFESTLDDIAYNPGTYNTRSGWFDQAYIAGTSARGLELRSGLIASRSAVSANVYDDLDKVNQDGTRGIYFPPDLADTSSANTLAWSSPYRPTGDGSAVAGINIPSDFAIRPTSSVFSTRTDLIGVVTPSDPIQLPYDIYLSGSRAVRNVLDGIQGIAAGGPYARLGNNPERTQFSVWHDPSLNYFAWDDFTPGTASITYFSLTEGCSGAPGYETYDTTYGYQYFGQYKNDINPLAKIQFSATWSNDVGAGNFQPAYSQSTPLIVMTGSNVATVDGLTRPTAYAYTASATGISIPIGGVTANMRVSITASFYDVRITSSRTINRTTHSIYFNCP
jgi:hypothetical protein